jgi:hypothetical protein
MAVAATQFSVIKLEGIKLTSVGEKNKKEAAA